MTTLEDGETVVGYYALAAAQVAPDEATARALKGQPRARPVPAILLARLAVDGPHQGTGLGRSLLQDVLLRCLEAADAIGARALLVHAKHEPAKAWYMQYGFEESPTDPLHLLMPLKDARTFLQRHGAVPAEDLRDLTRRLVARDPKRLFTASRGESAAAEADLGGAVPAGSLPAAPIETAAARAAHVSGR